MQPKIHKKSTLLSLCLISLLVALCVVAPMDAYAWTPTPPNSPETVCENEADYTGFTRRIVLCVKNTVLAAVDRLLGPLFSAFYAMLGAVLTLAVAVWGIMLAGGHSRWSIRHGGGLAIKIAVLVTLFTGSSFDFIYFYGAALDVMSETLGAVTNYVAFSPTLDCGVDASSDPSMAVWDHVDCTLNTLIGGIYNNSDVTFGIGGFLLAALLSGGPGIFVALLGILVIVQVLFAIARALYIFVLAYVAFSLMALVSPIFLPMMMFKSTQGYFEKWLKLTIGFILQPIFLFVYLAMLLAAYDVMVYSGPGSVFNILSNDQYIGGCSASCGGGGGGGCPVSCPPIGHWLRDTQDVYLEQKRGNLSVNFDVSNASGKQTCAPSTGGGGGATCSAPDLIQDEAGMANKLAEVPTSTSNWSSVTDNVQKHVYSALNINDYFFHVNTPVQTVDWDHLADLGGGSVDRFFYKLITALFMAVATTYVFLLLLEKLPFIGSGVMNIGSFISSGSGMPGFGFGGLAPPGASMASNLQKRVFGK